jgi:methyl-accepting chemotaxis protein
MGAVVGVSMLHISNMRIPTRIAIATILPLLAFAGFAAKSLSEKWSASQAAGRVAVVVESVPLVSELIHQLQRERGASATFVTSKGQALADVMRNQRGATDKAIAEWRKGLSEIDPSTLGAGFGRALAQAQPAVADIVNMRRDIDALSITAPKTAEYFTTTIAHLIGLIEATGNLSDDLRIGLGSRAFVAIVKRKELTGQERATGSGAFAIGEFAPDVHRNFLRLLALQDAQTQAFEKDAMQAEIDAVANTLKGPVVDELARMRAVAAAAPFDRAAVKSVAAQQWFNTISQYIDLLKTAEDRVATEFLNLTHAVVKEAQAAFYGIAAIFIAILSLVVAMTIVVVRSITRPIARLLPTMRELAKGNHDIDVADTKRGDEIGEMAKAVLVFREAGIENARLQAQAREQDKKMATERAAAEAKVMAELDAAVGGIVKAAMAGDFSQRVPLAGKEGTIRSLAESMNVMCENMGRVMDNLVTMLRALAEGNLKQRISGSYEGMFAILKDCANTTAETLSKTMLDIRAAVDEVTNAAAEISTSTTDLSQRTEEQAASLEQTSASMEEMSVTVKQNAGNAQQASQLAASARAMADRGSAVVTSTVEAMSRIENSSNKIADIIGVIDEIARQINLLALNAAVEAARAGEAGRGFAVVASEVRSLAQRSAQAAKDINDLISNSSMQVKDGADLVNRTGESLKEIVESVRRVADIIAEIATASVEQSTGIDQINKALTQMDEMTQQNSALVEENAAAAKTLEQQSETMTQRVAFFELGGNDGRDVAMPSAA